MRTKLITFAVLCTLAGAAIRAQQAPPAPQQQAPPAAPQQPAVTFRVDVNYVEIDAVVTDAQGKFVHDLTKDDFQVLEDGKPQALSVFSKVEIPIERADPPLFSRNVILTDVASNARPFEGRLFILVIDDLHTRFSRSPRTRAAARQFVERYVGGNDMAAVVNTSGVGSAMQDFTNNRQLMLRAIDRAMGVKADTATSAQIEDYFRNRDMPSGAGSDMSAKSNEIERFTKARNTLATLKNLADYLAGMRGRRKALVYFSEGIDYDISNPIQNTYATDVQNQMQDLVAAATRANVNIYSVDPRGVASIGEEVMDIQSLPEDNSIGTTNLYNELRIEQDSLRYVSDETGGFAVLNQNDFRTGFGRILDDNSRYYVLGYYSTNEKRDGRFRNVSVKLLKPGLTVRTRKGYVAAKGKPEASKSAAAGTSTELRDALESPIPISGLTISAFAAPFRGPAPKDAIDIAIEVDGRKLAFKNENGLFRDDLEISMFAANDAGKVAGGAHDVVNLTLKPQTHEIVSRDRFRILRRLELPPGKYQMRIGARETNGGLTGTLIYDLDAPDFSKSPLVMSGIAITSATASRVPTGSAPGVNDFKDVLPAPPTSSRDFPSGDQLAIFAEVYDNLGAAAHRIAITATVLADDGKTVFTTSDERRSEELHGASGGYGYMAKIPLTGMAPGRYVLRIEAKSLTGKGDSAVRELEFRVR